MNRKFKEFVDSGNVSRVRTIFLDALDVDPTFEKYKEEYGYAKENLPGFLEPHQDLTPFVRDQGRWDEDYWVSLKGDLRKNFSEQRFVHMREVAEIFYAEKIHRIHWERQNQQASPKVETNPLASPQQSQFEPKPIISTFHSEETDALQTKPDSSVTLTWEEAKQKQKEVEEKIAQKNKKTEQHVQESRRATAEEPRRRASHSASKEVDSSKKVLGIALIAAVVVVLTILLK